MTSSTPSHTLRTMTTIVSPRASGAMIGMLQPKWRASHHAGEPCSCAAVKCVTVTPSGHQPRFAFQRFYEQGPASASPGSNLVIVTAEFPRRAARISSASLRALRSLLWQLRLLSCNQSTWRTRPDEVLEPRHGIGDTALDIMCAVRFVHELTSTAFFGVCQRFPA